MVRCNFLLKTAINCLVSPPAVRQTPSNFVRLNQCQASAHFAMQLNLASLKLLGQPASKPRLGLACGYKHRRCWMLESISVRNWWASGRLIGWVTELLILSIETRPRKDFCKESCPYLFSVHGQALAVSKDQQSKWRLHLPSLRWYEGLPSSAAN